MGSPGYLAAAVERVLPAASIVDVATPVVDHTNHTVIVDVDHRGERQRLVIRRYAESQGYDNGAKARREYRAFERFVVHGIPGPVPLLLDDTGAILGSPGIVTSWVPGRHVFEPAEPHVWVHHLAATLASLHSIPTQGLDDLLDGDAEVVWFANGSRPPTFMQRAPLGEAVWQRVRENLPRRAPVAPTLQHLDYWAGNILWEGSKISGVLDLEEAALGDPGYDVAYARLDLAMLGCGELAEEFLAAYEAEARRSVANLGLWELAASARPMFGWGDSIQRSPGRERLQGFVSAALERSS